MYADLTPDPWADYGPADEAHDLYSEYGFDTDEPCDQAASSDKTPAF